MCKIISLLVLQAIFCSTLFTLSYSHNTLIESTCQKTPFFALCVSTLKHYPGSTTADVAGLARIVANSLDAKASATLTKISSLLHRAKFPKLKKTLNSCIDSYNTIVQADIPVAIEAITKGNPKFAVDSATDAANEAQICEAKIGTSLISGSNKVVYDLSIVLKSIASLLL